MTMDAQQALAVIGEPTRYRIVQLLAEAPRTVGEVAESLGALQPQTTKHLQALEAAGLIHIHRLGRRRVASLDRAALARLAGHLQELAAETADTATDDDALAAYERAIAEESGRSTANDDRAVRLERLLPAAVADVWAAWTDPALAAQWWAPRHFTVAECEIAPTPGAPVRLVLREGDDAEYTSAGRVVEVSPATRLVYELAPVGPAGAPLFQAVHTVEFTPVPRDGAATRVTLDIDVSAVAEGAAPAVAGIRLGWEQLLDALAALVSRR
ncbi:metalloregulator ArsR/SmtB family transcription factor [Leifsonia naganoensis]|uniref:Uncharacterized protein YndB with AHSA1/START domain/DNA-binding transcriptional ArsR family regulator n=1 Tax=Leifsonia naganoensis TaxID=150025 RepID=A0A853DRH0_9MICO|nr:metalloregulator ArsR/SmtB family transcription factor [Leifsonia naganoensis]NYK10827.1 uncharacterized protein YndB with AHSA1/START domain/DNA-binding transcriptional ArsR family regulator [Leifsonia naganoensis]